MMKTPVVRARLEAGARPPTLSGASNEVLARAALFAFGFHVKPDLDTGLTTDSRWGQSRLSGVQLNGRS